MTSGLLLAFIFLQINAGFSQEELIINGSFEELNSCPRMGADGYSGSTIELVKGWMNPVKPENFSLQPTPDIFHKCGDSVYSVPKNGAGYQHPASGNGYAGLFLANNFDNSGEFIQVRLDKPTVKGLRYRFAFKYVYGQCASYKINCINFLFTEAMIAIPDSAHLYSGNYFPGVDSNDVIEVDGLLNNDTTEWVTRSVEFIAKSNARYLTIGNIKNRSEIIFERAWRTIYGVYTNSAYILLDDISLVCAEENGCDDVGIEPMPAKPGLSIYPNPASTFIRLGEDETLNGKSFTITNLSGVIVRAGILDNSGMLDITACENGFYVLTVEVVPGEFQRAKFMICR